MLQPIRRSGFQALRLSCRRLSTAEPTAEANASGRSIFDGYTPLTVKYPSEKPSFEPSKELKQELDKAYREFINEFSVDHTYTEEVDEITTSSYRPTLSIDEILYPRSTQVEAEGNMYGNVKYPELTITKPDEPYSSQELYLRRQFHAQQVAGVGAVVEDVYRPHENRTKPKNIEDTGIATLLAAGAHLGHHSSLSNASMIPFIKGRRDAIHIIDLEQTLTSLKRAAKVTCDLAEKGGLVLFVGTREHHRETVISAASRCNGFYVHRRWVPGTLSNALDLSRDWARHEVDMADQPTGRELGEALKSTCIKPDMVVILNPVENKPLIQECIAQRVPTIAICDTNMDIKQITYPVFANDDSLRTCDLIAGILSNAARRGRQNRIEDFNNQKKMEEQLFSEDQTHGQAYALNPIEGAARDS